MVGLLRCAKVPEMLHALISWAENAVPHVAEGMWASLCVYNSGMLTP